MVRYLPPGSTAWYYAIDRLAGTEVYGDRADDTMEWSILFDNIPFTQFVFATGDLSSYIIALKDVILPGVDYYGVKLNFIRTSLRPDAEGLSQDHQFNKNRAWDPHLSLTSWDKDTLYLGNSGGNS